MSRFRSCVPDVERMEQRLPLEEARSHQPEALAHYLALTSVSAFARLLAYELE